MDVKKNELHEVDITGITSEGSGVAKIDGFAVFVPETAIGDRVLIRIVKVLKNYGFGKTEKIVSPAETRIEPDCECYTQCGGCTYRHITYQAELDTKQGYVENAFRRIGDINIDCNNIIGSRSDKEYRNKAQYPVGKDIDGNIISGFYAKRSHRIISSENCRLQPKVFSSIQSAILKFLNENKISVYNEVSNTGLIRHIYLRQAEATGEIMVCIVATSKSIPKLDILIKMLIELDDNIKSIIINVNSNSTNVILGDKCFTAYGNDYITDIICGVTINISPLAFYQVNKQQAEVLYNTAIEYAKLEKNEVLIDLYCGTGTIGLIASRKVSKVIGIEIIPQAIENAKANAILNGIDNVEFICADAGEAAQKLLEDDIKPDVVIVDPPRKGLDDRVIDAVVTMNPAKVVMISCNPSTAARDCGIFEKCGYKVEKVTPVDMFPRTGHVEVVIQMTFCGDKKK